MGNFLSFQPQVDQALTTLVFWEDIRSLLESKMDTNDERLFRNKLAKGYGVASPLHRVRLSDESYAEKDISSGVLPRFGFVVSVLSKSMAHAGKKRIHYRSEKVNMRFVTARNRLNSCAWNRVDKSQSRELTEKSADNRLIHKPLQPTNTPKAQEQSNIFGLDVLAHKCGGARLRQDSLMCWIKSNANSKLVVSSSWETMFFMYAPFLEKMAASLLYDKASLCVFHLVTRTTIPPWIGGLMPWKRRNLTSSPKVTITRTVGIYDLNWTDVFFRTSGWSLSSRKKGGVQLHGRRLSCRFQQCLVRQ